MTMHRKKRLINKQEVNIRDNSAVDYLIGVLKLQMDVQL